MPTAITSAEVALYMGIEMPAPEADLFVMDSVVAAVNIEIATNVPLVRALAPGAEWPASIYLAALMMAARLFLRRRSPTGVATYTETGGPVYTPRWDPDLEKLCLIGKWAPPGFG